MSEGQNNSQGNQGNRGNNNNRRRRHRRPPGNRPKGHGSQAGHHAGPQAEGGNNNNNRRRRSNNRNRRSRTPFLSPIERVQKQYLLILERHLQKRKKYFELFHRADPAQLRKLEEQFHQSGEELLKFRETVPEDLRVAFDQWNNGLKHDYSYAKNHQLELETTPPSFEGDFEDPHYLPSQQNANFSEDTEESTGTMEDYLTYKGEPIKPITH